MQAAGDVKSATVIRYPDGRSKGWGLVEFESSTGAQEAIASYNDRELMGRKIFIREDRETGEAGGLPPPGGAAADGSKGGGKGRGRGGRASRGSERAPGRRDPEFGAVHDPRRIWVALDFVEERRAPVNGLGANALIPTFANIAIAFAMLSADGSFDGSPKSPGCCRPYSTIAR